VRSEFWEEVAMLRRLSTLVAIGAFALLIGMPQAAQAQEPTPEDLRDFLLTYATAVKNCGQAECTGADDIEQQLLDLDEEQLQALYDAIDDVQCLMDTALIVIDYCVEEPECTDNDEDGYSPEGGDCGPWDCNDGNFEQHPGAEEVCNEEDDDCDGSVDEGVCADGSMRTQSSPARATVDRTPFPPDYPSGSTYDLFLGDITFFNLLNRGRTERANTDAVAGFWLAYEILQQATNGAQAVCDSTPSIDVFPGNAITCPPAGILNILTQMTAWFLDEVNFHEGNIDGAEIEAGYENSKKVLGNTAVIFDRLEKHDADINARLDVIEAKLAAMDAKLDQMLAWQLETIRLIMTPEGQRSTDVPACDGQPCDWPASNNRGNQGNQGNRGNRRSRGRR
jgi:hypothetical protein